MDDYGPYAANKSQQFAGDTVIHHSAAPTLDALAQKYHDGNTKCAPCRMLIGQKSARYKRELQCHPAEVIAQIAPYYKWCGLQLGWCERNSSNLHS